MQVSFHIDTRISYGLTSVVFLIAQAPLEHTSVHIKQAKFVGTL